MRFGGESTDPAWWVPPAPEGAEDLALWVVVAVGGVVLVVVLIPLLLFGIELIVLGFVIALGVLARALLRRPWRVQAEPTGGVGATRMWDVHGWWRSRHTIREVEQALSEGRSPAPTDAVERLTA
jgi:hypothetical protein